MIFYHFPTKKGKMYTIHKITPFSDLTKKELTALTIATERAHKSQFEVNRRLGAYLEAKGSRFLCR
jgi:hypothetical protein